MKRAELAYRKSTRLKGYDYTQGWVYVTLCAQDRAMVFGQIRGEAMQLSKAGEIVRDEWLKSPALRKDLGLDRFVIMPNHMHAIVTLGGESKLGHVMAQFKSVAAKRIKAEAGLEGTVWQRGYYDRIIRGESELAKIREYIENNPLQWALDEQNPESVRAGKGESWDC